MKKLKKLVVAGILASAMALSALAPTLAVAAATKPTGPIKLVTLGDSMTNGFGIAPCTDGTLPNKGFDRVYPNSYPDLLAGMLAEKFDREVEVRQLAINAFRTDDLQYLLEYNYKTNTPAFENDYYGTKVWYSKFNGNTDDSIEWSQAYVAEVFQTSIKEADYITFNLGSNNFSQFWLNDMMSVVGGTELTYKFDLAEKLFGETPAIKKMAINLYEKLRGALIDAIGSSNEGTISMVETLGGALVYAYVGLVKSYKSCLDDIFALNPDVNITLIGLSNMFRGITGKIGDVEIDMGSILGMVFGPVNNYIASLATSYTLAAKFSFSKNYTINYVSSYTMPDGTKIDKVQTMGDNYALPDEEVSELMIEQHNYMRGQYMTNFGSFGKTLKTLFNLEDDYKYESTEAAIEAYKKYHGKLKADITDYDYNEALKVAIYDAFEIVIKDVNTNKEFDLSPLIDVLGNLGGAFKGLNAEKLAGDLASEIETAYTTGDFSGFSAKVGEILGKIPAVRVMLYVEGNFLFCSGLGVHPSDVGHQMYADAIFNAIVNKIGAVDVKIMNKLNGAKDLIARLKNAVLGAVTGWFTPKTNEMFDLDTVLAVQTMMEEEPGEFEASAPAESDAVVVPAQSGMGFTGAAIALAATTIALGGMLVISVKRHF